MASSRREFLAQAGLAAGALAAAGIAPGALGAVIGGREKKRILILGGTGFLGPHLVWDALKRGHEVTMFNRGQTAPDLFDDQQAETLIGDRYSDYASLEEAVAAGRTWDAVIDTFAYVPKVVEDAIGVLRPAIGQYVVISTMSVYASNDEPGADESSPVATVTDEVSDGIPTHREVGMHYGAMKARCEAAAERLMPGSATNLRPGLICGARDTTGRFTYWPVRASEGGTMIGPGSPTDPVQIIDVRDLARFAIHSIETKLTGEFNVITPADTMTIGDVVEGSIATADAGTQAEWVDAAFLAAQGVQAWQHMPAWVPPTTPGYSGFGRQSSARALAAGLTCRSARETAAYALEYFRTRGPEIEAERGAEFAQQWRTQVRGGLPLEREQAVLELWRHRG